MTEPTPVIHRPVPDDQRLAPCVVTADLYGIRSAAIPLYLPNEHDAPGAPDANSCTARPCHHWTGVGFVKCAGLIGHFSPRPEPAPRA
jgi:hypothetical protein